MKAKQGDVTFNHKEHGENYACAKCHGTGTPGKLAMGKDQAHALCKGVPRRDGDHLEVKGAGHYGIFSGRRWRTVVYPQVKAFIADYHAKAVAKASAAGGKAEEDTSAAERDKARDEARQQRAGPKSFEQIAVDETNQATANILARLNHAE